MREAVGEGVAVTHLSTHRFPGDAQLAVPPLPVHLLPAQGPVVARPHPPAQPGLHLRVAAQLRHHHRHGARATITHAQALGGRAPSTLARVQAINSHF